jgi:23S rRNA (cytosine1962-C5)-methyltransferase
MMTSGPPKIAPDPSTLRTLAWPDYALVDSGDGRKLERYGQYRVVRPEPQCLWRPKLPEADWTGADAIFDPSDEEEAGHWRFSKPPAETWPLAWREVKFHGRFTNFRHLAFFPEQAANWDWLDQAVRNQARERKSAGAEPPRVLNLFGYTGVASLVCAAAGAAVTHVDASKKAIGWARENAVLSKMEDKPVRWICEDARRYVQREVRRESKYEGIILDPPKYGRGPTGEVWRLFEDVPELVRLCAQLLSDDASFLILNAYAARISGPALAGLLADALPERGGRIDWGELALVQEDGTREIGLSFFARWSRG